ncbi:AraC family transcriptional regulator [Micromonospora globispora]|uniref:AraC family transcriptional regulator n=2 Tax=Micromonospora globispora TaxID=1450148 RepID=A0A317K5F9_9ACTN|nr:AraC family transcriptional regulator [Micromonospora globispora]
MVDAAEMAVERVIAAMRVNLGEPLTIDDMARTALFSKFHFSRIFQRVTGVSPGRFLSAMRLQEAKKLLVSTSLNVADISMRVGYRSVGTFSTRFTRSVGLSPTAYRRLGGYTPQIAQAGAHHSGSTIRGRVTFGSGDPGGFIFLGLFPDRIPEGRPVRCLVLDRPGAFRLDNVPEGTWYVLVQSVAAPPEVAVSHTFDGDQGLSVGTLGPLTVPRGVAITGADVQLMPMRAMDPPVLLALLDVRKAALSESLRDSAA